MKTLYLLLAWFGLMFCFSLTGFFESQNGPPLRLLISVVIPLLLYGLDKPLLKGAMFGGLEKLSPHTAIFIQTFRVLGLCFLVDCARGNLPSGFAIPAGVGDIVVGLAAPWVAFNLMEKRLQSEQVARRWNYLGIFDLVLALTMGVTHQKSALGIFAQEISMQPIGEYPLSLIPTWIVPLALILHLDTLKKINAPSVLQPPNLVHTT